MVWIFFFVSSSLTSLALPQILKNFTEYKYNARVNDNRYEPAKRLVNSLMTLMNRPDFLDTAEKSHRLLRERLSPHLDHRWLKWCVRGTHRLTETFGRTFLRAILPGLKEVAKAKLPPTEVESIYPQFFKDLEKEAALDDALIFAEDFADKWGLLRQLEESLENNEDITGGVGARRMQLELIDKYMPKRPPPTPEPSVKQESVAKPVDKPVVWNCKVPAELYPETCRDAEARKEERIGLLTVRGVKEKERKNSNFFLFF
jgi:hypothetical protein